MDDLRRRAGVAHPRRLAARRHVDPAVIGSAVIALYMGLEIVARMRGGDSTGSSALMTTLVQAAPWIDQLLGKAPPARRRPTTAVAIE